MSAPGMIKCPLCGGATYEGATCWGCLAKAARAGLPAGPVVKVTPAGGRTPVRAPRLRLAGKMAFGGLTFAAMLVAIMVVIGAIVYGISEAHLRSSAASSRSGATSAAYAQTLSDPQSSSALLGLINSRPGYDLYRITFADPLGNQPQELGYVFSSDTVYYIYFQFDGTPVSFTWKGHGIERLRRESEGGTLDDN